METPLTGNENLSRKQFLFLAATSIAAASCESLNTGSNPTGTKAAQVIDAGPESSYSGEGLYNNFRDQGFFLARRQGKLTALSSYCTHRHCKLEAEPDRTFYCPCHGSTFDSGGKVTEGPATLDLPACSLTIDARGHVLVTVA